MFDDILTPMNHREIEYNAKKLSGCDIPDSFHAHADAGKRCHWRAALTARRQERRTVLCAAIHRHQKERYSRKNSCCHKRLLCGTGWRRQAHAYLMMIW